VSARAPLPPVRHALVAGVAEPPARALAVALARHGATVSVAPLSMERDEVTAAHSILNECWSLGREGQALELGASGAAEAIAALEAAVGPLDLAVAFAEAGLDVLTAAGARMRERGTGRVVFAGDAAASARWSSIAPRAPSALAVDVRGAAPERLLELVLGEPEARA